MATKARVDSAMSPISRLPPELLATIFIHRACDHYIHHGSNCPPFPSWINVSYVCRRWRSLALDCPTLWTYHFVVSPRWTEELLARSRQSSLKIRFSLCPLDDQSHGGLSLVDEWMKHAERIQELVLGPPVEHVQNVLSKLSSRAPRLQTLKILPLGPRDSPSRSFVLFDGHTPFLHTLELSDCPVVLPSLQLSGLTTLVLRDVPIGFQQSVEEFLAMLSCMRNLEHLELDHALTSATGFLSGVATITFQKINLSHISRFSIAAPLSTVIIFLSRVNIPFETKVRLHCTLGDDSIDHTALFVSLLAKRFNMAENQALSVSIIRSLLVEFTWRTARIAFSAAEFSCDSFCNCNSLLEIAIDSTSSMIACDSDHIVNDICCAIPLRNVQSVHVIRPPPSLAFWRGTLGNLPDLRYIKLSRGPMPDLASVLSHITDDGEIELGGYTRELVPALEVLELCQISFLPEDAESQDIIAGGRYCLFDALSTRDVTQGRLIMTQCRVRHSGRLPDMVRSWDGMEVCVLNE